jgi:membrane protein YqaA with SNARE-associated domain
MRSLIRGIVGTFTSPLGIVVLAALDSTVFFSLPFGIDTAVIILAAQPGRPAWIVPLLATAGSVGGAALTFWMGAKIGEKSLDRFMSPRRLKNIQKRIRTSGAIALALLDLIPPPFPFTPCVLAAGALEVRPVTFFATLAVCRLVRFGAEAWLAALYGRRILHWLDSDIFHDIVSACLVFALIATVWSIVQVVRATRPSRRRAAVA